MLRPINDLLEQSGFVTGIVTGSVFAAGCVLVALLALPSHRPVAVAGVAFWLGTWVATMTSSLSFPRAGMLFVGLAALGAAGTISAGLGLRFLLRLLLVLPGALFVAQALVPSDRAFVRPVLIVFVVVGAAAASEWNRWTPAADADPLLLLLTVAGVYVCVPDTEHAALALAVAMPLAFLGWPSRCSAVGAGGAAALVGVVAWLAGTDGVGRPGAVVGAAACIGVFVLVPLLRRTSVPLTGAGRMRSGARPVLAVIGVQAVLVGMCSRVAGLQASAISSAVIATSAFAGAFVAIRLLFAPRWGSTPGTIR